ncbi:response regulator transcription factor [Sphingobacterium sp. Ag1]|uniref:response regulator transcription factor n=1 Tax=Sphingobacterium sp. Ag1 TaxID=1643451 RepID=UPI0006994920|nr:response regulator [Sphingobacterium sp. Ag1]
MGNNPRRKIKIAFVDDSLFQRNLAELMVGNSREFELILNCSNGVELMAKLGEMADLPEVCLVDLHMPMMDCQQTALHLRDEFPSIKLFGYTTTEDIDELENFKASGTLFIFNKTNLKMVLEDIKFWLDDEN